MGRFTGPRNKIARRLGVNLGLKTNPSKVARRLKQTPGAHGPTMKRRSGSSYGKQMAEKQKAKYAYGVRENQFRNYVNEAVRQGGDSGVNLQRLLERRLDNVVYRLGFADTRAQARQLVNHAMFTVGGKFLDIPSYLVRAGDVVALKETKKKKKLFEGVGEKLSRKETPSWLSVDPAQASGKMLGLPEERDFEKIFDVRQIIEFYSSR